MRDQEALSDQRSALSTVSRGAVGFGIARPVAGDGTVGAFFHIALSSDDQWLPSVSGNEGSGQFLVVWSEVAGAVSAIYAQRVTLTGAPNGPRMVVTTNSNADRAAGHESSFLVGFDGILWPANGRDVLGWMAFGEIFKDGFESGDTTLWSASSLSGGITSPVECPTRSSDPISMDALRIMWSEWRLFSEDIWRAGRWLPVCGQEPIGRAGSQESRLR